MEWQALASLALAMGTMGAVVIGGVQYLRARDVRRRALERELDALQAAAEHGVAVTAHLAEQIEAHQRTLDAAAVQPPQAFDLSAIVSEIQPPPGENMDRPFVSGRRDQTFTRLGVWNDAQTGYPDYTEVTTHGDSTRRYVALPVSRGVAPGTFVTADGRPAGMTDTAIGIAQGDGTVQTTGGAVVRLGPMATETAANFAELGAAGGQTTDAILRLNEFLELGEGRALSEAERTRFAARLARHRQSKPEPPAPAVRPSGRKFDLEED